jgi:hypothetical protein
MNVNRLQLGPWGLVAPTQMLTIIQVHIRCEMGRQAGLKKPLTSGQAREGVFMFGVKPMRLVALLDQSNSSSHHIQRLAQSLHRLLGLNILVHYPMWTMTTAS